MRRLLSSLLVIAGCAGCAGCAGPGSRVTSPVATPLPMPATPTLASRVDSIIAMPPLHRTSWGIQLTDLTTGETLYSRNAGKLFIPASNMKLVVGAAALAKLGVDSRYETELLAAGRAGDTATALIVFGAGDPTWSMRFHTSEIAVLDSIALLFAQSGVRAATELVIDVSRFTDELVHSAWEVGDLPFQYAPPVDAVAMSEGVFRYIISGTSPGTPAAGRFITPIAQPVHVNVTTDTARARPRISIDYTARRDTIYITGSIGAGVSDTSTLAMTLPADVTGRALADALRRAGVLVSDVRVLRDSSSAARLRARASRVGAWQSPPMRDIAAGMLRPSQNWMAEQMHKSLGAHFRKGGSWRGGIEVERAFLYDEVRIDSGSVNLRDASGMAPQDLLSPETIVKLLKYARTQPWGPAFQEALAAPGLAGSTLSSRLRPLNGRVFAKTGSISNVNSLSGYLFAADGRPFAFSILSNGSGLPSAPVRVAIDAVATEFARAIDSVAKTVR